MLDGILNSRRLISRAIGAAALLLLAGAGAADAGGDGSAYGADHRVQAVCDGTFSDGTRIDVDNPVYLQDVPGAQTFCDLHTFGWNQFLYLMHDADGQQPRFMGYAPWYNLLSPPGRPVSEPGPYPGGDTSLKTYMLDKLQAGSSDELIDADGQLVRYDIRYNRVMYDSVKERGLYDQEGWFDLCDPEESGKCRNNPYLPPNDTVSADFLELKTAWRHFPNGDCPASEMFCEGRFGLIGAHVVQKTPTHGEAIWASFEHVANSPDCQPGGSAPIAEKAPNGMDWTLFDPDTVPSSVMTTGICDVTGNSPQCNGDPKDSGSGFKAVNICRTDFLPAGGASAANCKAMPAGTSQADGNNKGNVACLNASLEPRLPAPWSNYELIGSVWTEGGMGPTEDFRIKIFQDEAPGLPYVSAVGFPHLANTTMETYLQKDSTGYDPIGNNATQAGCFDCHNMPAYTNQMDLSHFPAKLDDSTADLVSAH